MNKKNIFAYNRENKLYIAPPLIIDNETIKYGIDIFDSIFVEYKY